MFDPCAGWFWLAAFHLIQTACWLIQNQIRIGSDFIIKQNVSSVIIILADILDIYIQ